MVFSSLREEHFERLLPSVTLGQHALLLKVWDCSTQWRSGLHELSPASALSSGSSSSKGISPRSTPLTSRHPFHKGSSESPVSPDLMSNVQDLARLYKQRSAEKFEKKETRQSPTSMLVILGGMLYSEELKRGVRKRYLAEPNPQKVELPRNATLPEVFGKAKELYFSEIDPDFDSMCLADSSGILLTIKDTKSWTLSSFYQKNHLQPSRYKLYVVVRDCVPTETHHEDHEGHVTKTETKLVHTESIISFCRDCSRPFRTYVPETVCKLPEGGSVFYREPQHLCPICDLEGYGSFMNKDLFPELCRVEVPATNESSDTSKEPNA